MATNSTLSVKFRGVADVAFANNATANNACKYDEVEIVLPSDSNNVLCSDVGLEGFDVEKCTDYCNVVVFQEFPELEVQGRYRGDATAGFRCFWGDAAVVACVPELDSIIDKTLTLVGLGPSSSSSHVQAAGVRN